MSTLDESTSLNGDGAGVFLRWHSYGDKEVFGENRGRGLKEDRRTPRRSSTPGTPRYPPSGRDRDSGKGGRSLFEGEELHDKKVFGEDRGRELKEDRGTPSTPRTPRCPPSGRDRDRGRGGRSTFDDEELHDKEFFGNNRGGGLKEDCGIPRTPRTPRTPRCPPSGRDRDCARSGRSIFDGEELQDKEVFGEDRGGGLKEDSETRRMPRALSTPRTPRCPPSGRDRDRWRGGRSGRDFDQRRRELLNERRREVSGEDGGPVGGGEEGGLCGSEGPSPGGPGRSRGDGPKDDHEDDQGDQDDGFTGGSRRPASRGPRRRCEGWRRRDEYGAYSSRYRNEDDAFAHGRRSHSEAPMRREKDGAFFLRDRIEDDEVKPGRRGRSLGPRRRSGVDVHSSQVSANWQAHPSAGRAAISFAAEMSTLDKITSLNDGGTGVLLSWHSYGGCGPATVLAVTPATAYGSTGRTGGSTLTGSVGGSRITSRAPAGRTGRILGRDREE